MALVHTPETIHNFFLPQFSALGVDDKVYSNKDFSLHKGLWVMFICNHCPYVKAIEERILITAKKLQTQGFDVLAICSNDAEEYPEDNFQNLQKRWKEMNYSFPYLYDEDQKIAKNFGAVCTPDFFLFDSDGLLKYRGRLDDNWKNADQVKMNELFLAAQCIILQQPIKEKIFSSMGCSIKWKNKIK